MGTFKQQLAKKQREQAKIAKQLGVNPGGMDTPNAIPVNPEEHAAQLKQAAEMGGYDTAAISTDAPAPARRNTPVAQPVQEQVQQPVAEDEAVAVEKEPSPFDGMTDPPTQAMIDGWKRQWPDVYVLPLDDKTVVVYRYLSNFEWQNQIMNQSNLTGNEDALTEAVLRRCVLWPTLSPEWMNQAQAGLPKLIFEVIMRSSYFIEPELAITLVQRL